MTDDTRTASQQIAEAVFPGKLVRRMTITIEANCLATVHAEIFVGDELRTVAGILGANPDWKFVDKSQEGAA